MEFEEFITKNLSKENIPILFIGSGFTKRYCKINNSFPPDWVELLKQIISVYSDEEFKYALLKKEVEEELGNEVPNAIINQKIASKIEREFNLNILQKKLIDKELEEKILEKYRSNNNLSPMKIYISMFFSEIKLTDDPILLEELEKLKIISKKSFIILTTNYDKLLETIFQEYDVIKGQQLITSSPIGNIFKIHGCVTDPGTVVITKEDYQRIETRQKVLNARLVTFFAEHPVFFLGYSLDDLNIQEFMDQVYYSFTGNPDIIEKISEKFLVIEWKKNKTDTIVESATLMKQYKMPLKKMETDNYIKIFEILNKLNINISVKELKAAEGIFTLALKGNKEKNLIFANTVDLSTLNNQELLSRDVIIGFGAQILNCIYSNELNAFKIIGYKSRNIVIDSEDFMKVYLPDLKKRNTKGVIPFFYYFKDCYNDIEKFDIDLLLNIYEKLKKCIKKIEEFKFKNSYKTIADVEKNIISNSAKENQLLYLYLNNIISNKEIKKYTHIKLAQNKDKLNTFLRKLIALYDMKVYATDEMIIKLDNL